ncbi:MAG: DUF4398 domain-containing protein [Pseudomonadota bacterium]|nr:DUF4398 domain-containing protein [Pseudomonadota bacterium]
MHIFSPPAASASRLYGVTAALLLTLALASCASVPPPDSSMNQAQTQLQLARDAGAADYAPVDLDFAQNKFQQAQAAMVSRDYADAANLATESVADAELAQAKGRLGAARAQMQNKVQENSRLRAQGERNAADGSAPRAMPTRSTFEPVPAQNMPAPASSTLSAPAAGGFQNVPDNSRPADSDPQGGQP